MKIAFLGDIAAFDYGLLKGDWKSYFRNIANLLSEYDFVLANLETPITERKYTLRCKGMHLKSSPKIVEAIKFLNISAVNLCNNHIYDFGRKGVDDTIEALTTAGIDFFGIDRKDYFIEEIGMRIHSYCCYSTNASGFLKGDETGISPLRYPDLLKEVEKDKINQVLSCVCLHWGDEYSPYANRTQYNCFRKISEVNDCIIYGHHAHMMQGLEIYNRSLAAYNLGNFYFDDCISPINKQIKIKQSPENRESFILSVEIENSKILKYETVCFRFDNNKFALIDNVKRLKLLSEKLKFCAEDIYKETARSEIARLRKENLAPHDYKWLLSKINYYSIGAKILSEINKKRFYNEFIRYLEE